MNEVHRAPRLPRVDPVTVVVLVVVLAVVVAASWALPRAVRSGRAWEERAVAAETAGREQRIEAEEERRTRDLVLSTMQDGVMLIGRDAGVAFANDAIARAPSLDPRFPRCRVAARPSNGDPRESSAC